MISVRGTGKIIKNPCDTCSGTGSTKKTRKIEINIPAGIDDGQAIALTNQGDIGKNSGPNGDLFIVVSVMKHRLFKREGNKISFEIKIPFVKAVLGGYIKIPTLEGEENFYIPEGTQSGEVFVLKNKGVPNRLGRGNLEFRVEIDVPKKLSEKQKELLEQYAVSCSEEIEKKKSFFGK